jgi:hypothetical protein
MRNGGDREFRSSVCELAVHAFIVRSGYKAVVHPNVPGSTTGPDFAATDEVGNVVAYIELTTVNPPDRHAAEANRENPVFNAIMQGRCSWRETGFRSSTILAGAGPGSSGRQSPRGRGL